MNKELPGNSLLYFAAYYKSLEICEVILDHGYDPNLLDKYRYSPLMYACKRGYIEMSKLLINRGAKVNYPDEL